jgi:TonB family protein
MGATEKRYVRDGQQAMSRTHRRTKENMRLGSCLRVMQTAALMVCLACVAPGVRADENRKVLVNPKPEYPEMARKLNLHGVARIQVTIAANGHVLDAKVVGGHPILANAALFAARNWKFEAGSSETTEILDFRFDGI